MHLLRHTLLKVIADPEGLDSLTLYDKQGKNIRIVKVLEDKNRIVVYFARSTGRLAESQKRPRPNEYHPKKHNRSHDRWQCEKAQSKLDKGDL